MPISRPLRPGVWAPILTFFDSQTEDLDIPTFKKQVAHVAQAGVAPVLAGSNGEGPHLSHSERQTLIRAAREALDDAGLGSVPIIAGAGAASTRETVELCTEAAEAGADYTLVITGGYFAGALAKNKAALKAFYAEVAERSPIPVLIYNYPGASGGIDLDSDLITELAIECPNTAGVKLTCGDVGKLTRIAAAVSDSSFASAHPRKNPDAPFTVLGGYTDILLASVYANGHGCITGLGNIAPYSIAKLYELATGSLKDPSLLPEAQRVQGIVARADSTVAKAGIGATKAILERLQGYGGVPRKPLPPYSAEETAALWDHPHVRDIVALERQLSG